MIRKLFKPYIFIFLTILLIWNWESVSWAFSYRVATEKISDAFDVTSAQTATSVQESENLNNETIKEEKAVNNVVSGNRLEIPKINISVPLISVSAVGEVYAALDRGAVVYPTSVLPGEDGQTIILGHSAPENWPMIKHDWIFSDLNDLTAGDNFTVYFNNEKLEYVVVKKVFLEKGEDVPTDLTNSGNVIHLISCWPPGKDIRRISVEAQQL